MSDTISRQEMLRTYQELCMNIACSECSFYFGDVLTGDCLLEKWIHSLPSAEPKTPSNGSITSINPENTHDRTMGDCISRKDAIKSMANAIWHYPNELYTGLNSYEMSEALAKDGLMFLPSAEPEQKTGKWIDHSDDGYVECPFCYSATNCDGDKDELHYCFSCGADMRGEADEN